MLYETKDDAVHAMVSAYNRFPKSMIEMLMMNDPEGWHEVTVPVEGDEVRFYDKDRRGFIFERLENGYYIIALDPGADVICPESEFEVIREDWLPIWGWLWQFDDEIDDWWLEEKDGIRIMSELGFRIFESDEFGYFFGIDGGGIDFYEAFWTPLYEARGFLWHKDAV